MLSRLWMVPMVPPSLNRWQSMHWAERRTIKRDWYEWFWGLMNNRETQLPLHRPFVLASAVLVFRTGAHRDLTNYEATLWKIVPDALQHVGVLDDDDERHFRPGQVTFRVDKTLRGIGRHPEQKGGCWLALVTTAGDQNVRTGT